MPELPEVETIVNELAPALAGRNVAAVAVRDPMVLPQGEAEFRRCLVGQCIERVHRRAKYIIGDLQNGEKLVVHLGMTGRLMLRPAGAPEDRFTRATIVLDDGRELRYADQRKFGHLSVMKAEDWAVRESRLGPEPLSEDFTAGRLEKMLARHKGALKALLLNQTFLAGLGNIYADEALFDARLHPEQPANSLSCQEVRRLFESIRRVLRRGIANRGTTFSDYRDARGRPGRNQLSLAVYQRQDQACPKCGGVVERVRVGGRSSHFCPRCQPLAAGHRAGPAAQSTHSVQQDGEEVALCG